MSLDILVDGQPGTQIPAHDRAFQYGDGVFRTMLVWDGAIQALQAQLDKLYADAAALALHAPGREELEHTLKTRALSLHRGVVKLLISAGDSARGYARSANASRWVVFSAPLPALDHSLWRNGVIVADASWPLSENPLLAGIKHLNRLDQVMARRQLPQGCHESLMYDSHGQAVSGGMSNVLWYADGHWHTPALSRCGVAGQLRERIMHRLDSRLHIVAANREALQRADAIVLCNSVIGIWPVREWRDAQNQRVREWKNPGEHAAVQQLRALIQHPWQGEHV